MDDLISRQAAIDAIRAMQTYKLFAGDDQILVDQAGAQTELMMLPSAQTEIIRCKDCRWWERESICEGHCLEMDLHHFDEDYYCGFAERRTDEGSD